jgi:hypothetical protein
MNIIRPNFCTWVRGVLYGVHTAYKTLEQYKLPIKTHCICVLFCISSGPRNHFYMELFYLFPCLNCYTEHSHIFHKVTVGISHL